MSSEPERPSAAAPGPEIRDVASFDGTRIRYDLYASDRNRVVLVVPGFWRARRWPILEALAARIAAGGASAAVMDLRGHGESGGTFGFNLHEWRDVVAVARDLAGRGFRRIDLLGFSLGASIAVTAAVRGDGVPWGSLLLISPVADFALIRPRLNPFTMHRHLAFRQAFRRPRFDWSFAFREKIRAVDEIGKLTIPVTIVHVRRDWLIHHRHAETLFSRAREPKRLALLDIPGRWHADRILTSAPKAIDPILDEFLRK
ncbi:MAG TPA: alpha/beta fold hydrolase [Thermoanaerobaculia bacterium]